MASFHHFSIYQFIGPDQWKDAAERFLQLDEMVAELDRQDTEINHDELYAVFRNCEICDQLRELIERRKSFAEKFAPVWAHKALELDREKGGK